MILTSAFFHRYQNHYPVSMSPVRFITHESLASNLYTECKPCLFLEILPWQLDIILHSCCPKLPSSLPHHYSFAIPFTWLWFLCLVIVTLVLTARISHLVSSELCGHVFLFFSIHPFVAAASHLLPFHQASSEPWCHCQHQCLWRTNPRVTPVHSNVELPHRKRVNGCFTLTDLFNLW